MGDRGTEDDQRRDDLLRRLAKMPPKTQAELKRDLAAARKVARAGGKRSTDAKRGDTSA
jgi:hypothetical protein